MNKYELVLDIIEHPDKYSDEAISKILADKETAEIYRALAFTSAAVKVDSDNPDVDYEWQRFKNKTAVNKKRTPRMSVIRAASLGLLIVSSLAAVAIGISVKMGFIGGNNQEQSINAESAQTTESSVLTAESGTSIAPDSVIENIQPILYEDATLHTILDEISRIYNVPVRYGNDNVSSLRLHFRLDPSSPLQETVDRLDMFDSFDIYLVADTVTVK